MTHTNPVIWRGISTVNVSEWWAYSVTPVSVLIVENGAACWMVLVSWQTQCMDSKMKEETWITCWLHTLFWTKHSRTFQGHFRTQFQFFKDSINKKQVLVPHGQFFHQALWQLVPFVFKFQGLPRCVRTLSWYPWLFNNVLFKKSWNFPTSTSLTSL